MSFSEAARRCHVSQPGLSAQVRQAEETLGVRLFERDRRNVFVTPEGEAIVRRARRVLAETEELVSTAERFEEEGLVGTLRMGVIPTVAPYLLPQSLPRVRKEYPQLRLLLYEGQTHDIVARLHNGSLDLLLLALEADLGGAETHALFRDEFALALPSGHPLSNKRRVADADLATDEILLLDDGHCLRDQALPVCRRARAREVDDFRAGSLPTLAQMVASGLGMTLLPRIAIPVEAGRGAGLVTRPFRAPAPFRTIGLAWRPSSAKKRPFVELGRLMRPRAPASGTPYRSRRATAARPGVPAAAGAPTRATRGRRAGRDLMPG
jgi:LysR family hydrogen peroxide-inducible transcriptional activator